MKEIISSIILGLGGFDILGMLLLLTMINLNNTKKQIYRFSIITLISGILVGLLSTKLLHNLIKRISILYRYIPEKVYALIGLIIGVTLLIWFIERTCINKKYIRKEEKKENIFIKLIKKHSLLTSILFSLWTISDPTFWALSTLLTKTKNIILIIISFTIWMIIGQLPLYSLTIGVIFNKHMKINNYINKIKRSKKLLKIKKILNIIISIIILLISIYFILDNVYYFIKGYWFF